jgi:hypothetical protein
VQHGAGVEPGISGRGLEPVDIEKYDSVWKYVFTSCPVGSDVDVKLI